MISYNVFIRQAEDHVIIKSNSPTFRAKQTNDTATPPSPSHSRTNNGGTRLCLSRHHRHSHRYDIHILGSPKLGQRSGRKKRCHNCVQISRVKRTNCFQFMGTIFISFDDELLLVPSSKMAAKMVEMHDLI